MTTDQIKRMQAKLIAVGIDRVELDGGVKQVKADGQLGPVTYKAIEVFKRGYGRRKPRFARFTRRPSRNFRKALQWSFEREGRCSQHFFFKEFRSKGNGAIWVHFKLIRGLEAYRRLLGHPIRIVSGYRDPAYNKQVGGATQSQHMQGRAADLDPELSFAAVRGLRKFTGIGYQGSGPLQGKTRHVDVRATRTVLFPAIWQY